MASPAADATHPRLWIVGNTYTHGPSIQDMRTKVCANTAITTSFTTMLSLLNSKMGTTFGVDEDAAIYSALYAFVWLLQGGTDGHADFSAISPAVNWNGNNRAAYGAKARALLIQALQSIAPTKANRAGFEWMHCALAYDWLSAGYLSGLDQDTCIVEFADHYQRLPDANPVMTDDQTFIQEMNYLMAVLAFYKDRTGLGQANEGNAIAGTYDTYYNDLIFSPKGMLYQQAYFAPGFSNMAYEAHSDRDGMTPFFAAEAHRTAYTTQSKIDFWTTETSLTLFKDDVHTFQYHDAISQFPKWAAWAMAGEGGDARLVPGGKTLPPDAGEGTISHFHHTVRAARFFAGIDDDAASLAQWFIDNVPRFSTITPVDSYAFGSYIVFPEVVTAKRPDHVDIALDTSKWFETFGDIYLRTGWPSDGQILALATPATVDHTIIEMSVPRHRRMTYTHQNAGSFSIWRRGPLIAPCRAGQHGPNKQTYFHNTWTFQDPSQTGGQNLAWGGAQANQASNGWQNPGAPPGVGANVTDLSLFTGWRPDLGDQDQCFRWPSRLARHTFSTNVDYLYADLTRSYNSTRYNDNEGNSPNYISLLTRSLVWFKPANPATDPDIVVVCDRVVKGSAAYQAWFNMHFPTDPTVGGTAHPNLPVRNKCRYQLSGFGYTTYDGAGSNAFSVANTTDGCDGKLYGTVHYPTSTANFQLVKSGSPDRSSKWGQYGAYAVITSMTRSGSTVTVTTSSKHKMVAGDYVNIWNASQSEYNGDWVIASTPTTSSLTFDIGAATPASPATPDTTGGFPNEMRAQKHRDLTYVDPYGVPHNDGADSISAQNTLNTARNINFPPYRLELQMLENTTRHNCLTSFEAVDNGTAKSTTETLTESGGNFIGCRVGSKLAIFAKTPTQGTISVDYEEQPLTSGAITIPTAGTYQFAWCDLTPSRSVTITGGTSTVNGTTTAGGILYGTVTTAGAATTLTLSTAGATPTIAVDMLGEAIVGAVVTVASGSSGPVTGKRGSRSLKWRW